MKISFDPLWKTLIDRKLSKTDFAALVGLSKSTLAPEEPASDDYGWVHTNAGVFEELEALGLSKPVPKPEPKKRGRKKKEPVENKPKRPRGRPRKNPVNAIDKLL